jgi:hypothetical protein
VARVKKIVHADDEIQNCSNNAAFVITIATEMFIQHLVEKTHEIIKAEKRPRRNVQYGDVGTSRVFLSDSSAFLPKSAMLASSQSVEPTSIFQYYIKISFKLSAKTQASKRGRPT